MPNNDKQQGAILSREKLVQELTESVDLTRREAKAVVEAMLDAMVKALQQGDRIEIRNFGVFWSRVRAARTARNPVTGIKLDIPPKRVARFKPAKELEAKLNPPEEQAQAAEMP